MSELIGLNGNWAALDGHNNKIVVMNDNCETLFECECKRNWNNIEKIAELLEVAIAIVDNAIGVENEDIAYTM